MAPDLRELVRPPSTALLVVDVQNDFVHPDGRSGRSGTDLGPLQAAVVQINRLVDAARESGTAVIYIRVEHGPEVDTAPYRARYGRRGMTPGDTLCHAGTWGARLYEELRPPRAADLQLVKHGYDAFSVEELPALLREGGVGTVVVTGVVANLCVRATAFSAFERGFFPVVPRESTASVEDGVAERTLEDISHWYGEVVSVDEIVAAWQRAQVR
jgi:ureidoacrylate peracid hydrolase